MDPARAAAPTRVHLTRLMQIWRSAGWPCRDPIELDVVAAGWACATADAEGRETLRLTDEGVRLLAESRRRNRRALSAHDRLGHHVARQLADAGRIVWRELSLRSWVPAAKGPDGDADVAAPGALLAMEPEAFALAEPVAPTAAGSWRMARADVFSVRNTSVEAYLHPIVHEIKTSRADLLSDVRHEAKRLAYQGLCCECYYVFPAGIATPDDVPDGFGVWLLHGDVDTGTLEFARPARHAECRLPFAAWLALAKAVPWTPEDAAPLDGDTAGIGSAPQSELGRPPR
jgi:hypothetical protein